MKNLVTILASLLIGFLVTYMTLVRPLKQDRDELAVILDSTIYEFVEYRKETGEQVLTQQRVVASLHKAIAAGLVTQKELEEHNIRQLNNITRLEAQIQMLNVELQYTEEPEIIIKYVDSVNYDTYMRVPQQFLFNDKWVSVEGFVHKQGVTIENLNMRTETSIFSGYQSSGFLRTNPVVIIEYANPYMQGVAVQNVTIKSKPPWYNRPNFYRLQGAVGLYGLILLTR